MKDIHCIVGVHAWNKRHVEDSAYLECRRCGSQTDPPTRGPLGHRRRTGLLTAQDTRCELPVVRGGAEHGPDNRGSVLGVGRRPQEEPAP